MIIICPHCHGVIDIADTQIGTRQLCTRCTNWLLIGRHADGTCYGVKVQPPTVTRERRRAQRIEMRLDDKEQAVRAPRQATPIRVSPQQLDHFGLLLVSQNPLIVCCPRCGAEWRPMRLPRAGTQNTDWQCQNCCQKAKKADAE